ncbi:MAG TPA: response regulator [Burkholderiales bacterium]|nr:response regulator [Burkholderiales bacterium]
MILSNQYSPPGATASPANNAVAVSDHANILIVDDRPDKLLVFKTVLEELEQNVVTVNSGDEALRWLLKNEAAVILLDVHMPGMDGLEAAALIRARKQSAHIPIIFVTAYADDMHTARGYSLGAVDYILTPVVPYVLRSKVKVFVQLFHLTQQIKRQADERIALAREQAARAEAEESIRRANFLAEASKVMSSSLDADALLKGATRLAAPFLADMSVLTLVDENGRAYRSETAWISESELETAAVNITTDSLLAKAIERATASGEMELLNDLEPTGENLEIVTKNEADHLSGKVDFPYRHVAIFPLKARGAIRGVLTLGLGPSGRRFQPVELTLAQDIASRAAIALDNCLLYQAVQTADERKNEFLAMLAHELRNPLAPILHAVEIIQTFASDRQKLEWARGVMTRQLQQLVRLVDDLLDVSRITRGKIHIKRELIDVRTALTAAVEASRPLIELNGHELIISQPSEPIWVKADFARLAQIISNLLNNAAKFTERGGRISLRVHVEDNQVEFRVRDSGIGISQEMLSSIFELFTQANQTLDRAKGGLGIGLTLVRQLVRIHGGSVQAFSAGLGQGSEFVVRLPIFSKGYQDATSPALVASTREAAPRRILVVEDNVNSAEMLTAMLQLDGHEVQMTHEGATAIDMARSFQPDIILLDIGLPQLDGFEVARRVRASDETKNVTLIALSGYGQPADRQRAKEAGFDHHLVKPVDRITLTSLLASLSPENSNYAVLQSEWKERVG